MPRKVASKWIRNQADEQAVAEGCWFDLRAAERVIEFFIRFLRHSKGQWAGKPFEPLAWERDDILFPTFGWKRPDGLRRFRKEYIEIPKKNGKSSLMAGVNLFMLVGDGEPGAEVYSLANDRAQASIVYTEAANMVKASPSLTRRLVVTESQKFIGYPETKSSYKVLSSDADTAEGKNAHCLNVDELHAQKSRRLWDAMAYSGRARRQPLHLTITTAGADTDSICYEQHDLAENHLRDDGQPKDTSFLAVIYAAPKEADWTDLKVWRKANPSWGVTINSEDIKRDIAEAKKEPRKQNALRRYGLNQWTEQETRWIDMFQWEACKREIDVNDLIGRSCFAAMDLSIRRDMTSVLYAFPMEDGTIVLQPYFWTVRDTAEELATKHNVRIDQWEAEGLITVQGERTIDYREIREQINQYGGDHPVVEISFDPYNASQITRELGAEDGFEMVLFRQGFLSMGPACKEFEERYRAATIIHDGNPVLHWMMQNMTVKDDGRGNFAPVKPKRESHKKIDGAVCAIMAVARSVLSDAGGGEKNIVVIGDDSPPSPQQPAPAAVPAHSGASGWNSLLNALRNQK